jgi:hypothetical protein
VEDDRLARLVVLAVCVLLHRLGGLEGRGLRVLACRESVCVCVCKSSGGVCEQPPARRKSERCLWLLLLPSDAGCSATPCSRDWSVPLSWPASCAPHSLERQSVARAQAAIPTRPHSSTLAPFSPAPVGAPEGNQLLSRLVELQADTAAALHTPLAHTHTHTKNESDGGRGSFWRTFGSHLGLAVVTPQLATTSRD